jgi:hypothetical protein
MIRVSWEQRKFHRDETLLHCFQNLDVLETVTWNLHWDWPKGTYNGSSGSSLRCCFCRKHPVVAWRRRPRRLTRRRARPVLRGGGGGSNSVVLLVCARVVVVWRPPLSPLSSSATSTSPPHHPLPSSTPPWILVAAAPPLARRGRRQQRQLRDVLELRLEAFDTGSKIKAYPIRRLRWLSIGSADEGSWWHDLKFRSSENMFWSYHMFWTSENSIPWCVTSTILCRGCHSSGVSYLMSYPLSFLAYLSYC